IVAEKESGGEQRRVVPDLTVRAALVVFADDCPTRCDDALADLTPERRIGAVKQVGRDADLKQPDGFQVGAEEESRRSEHVVDVRIAVISLAVAFEDRRGNRAETIVHPEHVERRGMHRALGKPKLIPVDPESLMQLAAIDLPAARTLMLVAIEG